MNTTCLYHYYGTIERIIDGDSLIINMHLGFHLYYRTSCRLEDVNTPEMNATDPIARAEAVKAKNYLAELLPVGLKVVVVSRTLDKYKRPLVSISTLINNISINQQMIKAGYGIDL